MKKLIIYGFRLIGNLKHTQSIPRQEFFPQERTFYFFPAPKVICKLSALKMFFSVLSSN